MTIAQAAIPGQSGSGGSDTQNYCYDEHNRLVWAANNGTIPSAGNGTCGSASMSSTLGGNYTARYAYTNLGQLWQGPQNGTGAQEQYLYCDSSHPHQLSNLSQVSSSPTCTSKGTIDYTGSYDAWGNTTSQQEWYLYDSSGERVLRRSFDGTNTTLTVYAFGLEEHQYAYSGSGSTATNTSNTYYYTLAGRLLGTWDGSSPTTTFLLTDSLGSVVSSFNNPSSGAVMQGNQLYGPYGNQRLKQGSLSTSKGFTGQYNDGLTGLDYYNARYYDPTIGLFLSADTVQGNVGGMDPYAYVGGNPESRTDPTGRCPWCVVLLAGVVGGAIGAVVTDWITGQPVTWQSVAQGAVAGGLIAGAGLLIALLPPVAAALAAGGTFSGSAGAGAAISSFLTMNFAKVGIGLIGGVGGGMISGVATGIIQDLIGHFWPSPDPKQDTINAQSTVIAQQNKKINAQATSIAQLQKHTNAPATSTPEKTPIPNAGSISKPAYTYKSTSIYSSWTYSYSYVGTGYSYSDTVYHYTNPVYNYEVVSNTLNGYYERSGGGMHMR